MRNVLLEPWDSEGMKKFDEEADRALAVLNPKAYEEYIWRGRKRESRGIPSLIVIRHCRQ